MTKNNWFLLGICLLGLSFCQLARAELPYEQIKKAYADSYQYEKTENYRDAIKSIMLVYAHYPETYTVNLRLGYLHWLQGQFANAERHYQAAQKAMINAISPKLGLMSLAIAKQQFDSAEQLGFLILKQDPLNYYANLKLAYALTENKKYANAATVVEKMLALYPEDVSFLSQYAAIFAAQKQYDKATDYYSSVLILDPSNVSANYYFSVTK